MIQQHRFNCKGVWGQFLKLPSSIVSAAWYTTVVKDFLDESMRQQIMAALRARRQTHTFHCAYCGQEATGYEKARFCSPRCRLRDHREKHRHTPPAPPRPGKSTDV
jgi:predicted nucleic acid-binding Zn ribbon protein